MALTPDELRALQVLAEQFQEQLQLNNETYEKYLQDLIKSVDKTKEQIEELEAQKKIQDSIVGAQEVELALQARKLELQKQLGELTEEEYQLRIKSLQTTKDTAREFDGILANLTGVSAQWQNTALGRLMQPGGMQGFVLSLQRTFTASNILGSSLLKVREATIALAIATDQTLVEFNKATGATGLYGDEIVALEQDLFRYGVGLDDVGSSLTALTRNVHDLNNMTVGQRMRLAETTAVLNQMGVDAAITAQNFNVMTRQLGLTNEAARQATIDMFALAQSVGMPPGELASQFQSARPHLAKFGSQAVEVFKETALAAREAGMSVDEFLSITERFDTFDDAAQTVGKLNAALGGPFLNTMELVAAETPVERMQMLSSALEQGAVDFDQLTRHQRIYLTDALGLQDIGELALIMNGDFQSFGQTMETMSQKQLVDLKAQTADFNTLQEKSIQLGREFALQFGFVVDILKNLLVGIQTLQEYTNGYFIPTMTILAAAFSLFNGRLITTMVTQGLMAKILPVTTALMYAQGPAAAAAGSGGVAGAPGILIFSAAVLALGAALLLAGAGFALFATSLANLFEIATPEDMLSFGVTMLMVSAALNLFAAAAVFIGPVVILLAALSTALIGVAYALSLINFDNLRPIADLFMGLATIVNGEVENLTKTVGAVIELANAINAIDNEEKIVAVRQIIEAVSGRTTAPATPVGTAGTSASGGAVQNIYVQIDLDGRPMEKFIGKIINGMFVPFAG